MKIPFISASEILAPFSEPDVAISNPLAENDVLGATAPSLTAMLPSPPLAKNSPLPSCEVCL